MKFLLACLATICCLPAFALTPLSGGVYTNTTLTLAKSPYELTDDLVVFEGILLTIEPGVEIRVDSQKKIEIRGQISAIGTQTQPIYIHGNIAAHEQFFWKGIVFLGTSEPLGTGSQATFRYCRISDATYALDMNLAYHGPYEYRNCVFTDNYQVNQDGGMGGVLFDNCTFRYNQLGLSWFQFGGVISNCLFDGNVDGAIGTENITNCRFINNTGIALSPYGYTANCEFYHNNVGAECNFNFKNNTFINNKIKQNKIGVRILDYYNGDITFTGNEICDNDSINLELSTAKNANLSNNCWCLADAAAIRAKILDGYKDVSRGLVSFSPFTTGCSSYIPPTGAKEALSNFISITISPNPVYGNAGIKVSWRGVNDEHIRLIVRDFMGRSVHIEKISEGPGYKLINLNAASGVYYLSLTDVFTGATESRKILLQ
jgi:hypothetical protein